MKSRLAVFLLAAMVALPAVAERASSLTARSFSLEHKSSDRAAAMIRPLLSSDGTVSLQASTGTLVVTDRPENLKAISAALEQYDRPARQFSVLVKLVAASRSDNPTPVTADIREVAGKLGGVLRFNQFDKLGELRVEAREGSPVAGQELSPGYRAWFRLGEYDPASDTVRLEEFELRRSGAGGTLTPMLKTTLNLKVGQTVVLGASRDQQSQRALMIVATATPSQ